MIRLYRGVSTNNKKNGRYFSPDKEWVLQFTQSYRPEEVYCVDVDEKVIYRKNPLPFATGEFDDDIKEARGKGYKALWVDEGEGEPDSVFFFDPSPIRKLTPCGENMNRRASLIKQVMHSSRTAFKKISLEVEWSTDDMSGIEVDGEKVDAALEVHLKVSVDDSGDTTTPNGPAKWTLDHVDVKSVTGEGGDIEITEEVEKQVVKGFRSCDYNTEAFEEKVLDEITKKLPNANVH